MCGATLMVALAVGCAPAVPAADPTEIVKAAYERIGAGDLDGFMAYYAEDAVLSDKFGRANGLAAIRKIYEGDLAEAGLRFEVGDFKADGNVVTFTNKVYQGDVLVDTIAALDVVANGKIVFDGSADMYQKECEYDPSQKFCQKQ